MRAFAQSELQRDCRTRADAKVDVPGPQFIRL